MYLRFLLILISCICFTFVENAMSENKDKIALVMKALSNPFFATMENGAQNYAHQNNIQLESFGVERETEVSRQIGIVENLISREYGAIVIAPSDSKKLIPVCQKAINKGIIVVNIDNPFHKETLKKLNLTIPFVGSNNKKGASMVGEYIKRKLNNKGRVIVIEGIRGVENADLRKQGFIEAVEKNSQIKVIASESANWHTDEALSIVAKLLQEHGKVDAIFCANDNMALGAIQAFDMLGFSGKILLGAYDNIEEARLEMRNKRMHATIEQHPELMGAYGVEMAYNALSGKKIPDYKQTPLDLINYESFEKKIGLSLSDLNNPFFKSVKKGAVNAAKLYGISLTVSDAQNDDARQLVETQKFIQNNVDLLIINPTNSDTVTPVMEMAYSNGINIITLDRKSARDDLVVSHIASDNISGGAIAANFIAEKLNGKANILELEGIPGTSAAHDRGFGFDNEIKKWQGISIIAREVADFNRKKGEDIVSRLLKKNIKIDAIFAHNDEMILGAINAYEKQKMKLPVMVGFDGITDALKSIRNNKLSATIGQKTEEMGWLAVESAVKFIRGEILPDITLAEVKLIDK